MPSVASCIALAALTACGGGGGASPATAVATGDASSVPWNTATTLAVTSNDTIANGTSSVTVSTAPTHGTAVVQGNAIVYTPTTGYFGSDMLAYTLTVGGQTSTATVQLAVAATLTLSGTVRDAALPGAQVVATVGGVAQPTVTADANGNYQVVVTTATPTDFISLQAAGVGAQSGVVLSSLVGDASAAAAAATTGGAVGATAVPAVNITNVSTAIAVLSTQALGTTPASSAELDSVRGRFSAGQALDMATAIKLVADEGVALPSGVSSTLALVSDAAAYSAFVTAESSANAALFSTTESTVLADSALAVAPVSPVAGGADVSLVLTSGQDLGAESLTSLTLKADGTATVVGVSTQSATWASDGAQITVTYDTAQSSYTTSETGSDGNLYTAQETDTGFKVRMIGSGTAALATVGSYTFWAGTFGGPDANKTVALSDSWQIETAVAATQAFTADDDAIGTEWAGVLVPGVDPSVTGLANQDVLKIVDATHVLYERSGVSGTYVVSDGTLVVTTAGLGVYSYARLFVGHMGEDRWINTRLVDGAPTWAYDTAVVKVTSGLAFTIDGMAADYQSDIDVGLATGTQYYIDLLADGTGGGSYTPGASGLMTPLGTWAVASDGTMTLTQYYCNDGTTNVGTLCTAAEQQARVLSGETRTWTLLAASGSKVYVMEHLVQLGGTFDLYRINVYTKTN